VGVYLRSALVTLLVGGVVWGVFWKWNLSRTSDGQSEQKIATAQSMKENGLLDFEAKDLKGQSFRLSEYKGKLIILSFWASWCGPCVEEMPSMVSLLGKLGDKAVLVAVSADSSIEDVEKFFSQQGLVLPDNVIVTWDETRSIQQLYDIDRLPESLIADRSFKMVKKIVGSVNWDTGDSLSYMQGLLAPN
jgi:cytochrome c biogenesis protein CcmG/thiol:disulfide interchange protein DsbE